MKIILSITTIAVSLASTTVASADRGFTVPSKRTTCAQLGSGLYCASQNIKEKAYDGIGIVRLGRSGKARIVRSGNDLLIRIGSSSSRPTLDYGESWKAGGYRCQSETSGLTCRRGGHGFFLAVEKQRYF